MNKWSLVGLLVLGVALEGCKTSRTSNESSLDTFFENSLRRDAAQSENWAIAKVGGCTGFFVDNTAKTPMVATARHCVGYSMTDWCKQGSVYDVEMGESRNCIRVVAGEWKRDIVLIEVEGGKRELPAMKLAGFIPKAKTRLKMIGYPVDPHASGKLMVTENCWTADGQLHASPYKGTSYWDKGLQDQSYRHNCSTYGGNSGGPMLIEGTDVVVGLPFNYYRDEFDHRDFTETAYGASMVDFVESQRAALTAAGVTVVEVSPENGPSKYFRAATYTSPEMDCEFQVIPTYLTSALLTQIKVRWVKCSNESREYVVYECKTENLCEYEQTYIYDLSPSGFWYQSQNGSKVQFKLK